MWHEYLADEVRIPGIMLLRHSGTGALLPVRPQCPPIVYRPIVSNFRFDVAAGVDPFNPMRPGRFTAPIAACPCHSAGQSGNFFIHTANSENVMPALFTTFAHFNLL